MGITHKFIGALGETGGKPHGGGKNGASSGPVSWEKRWERTAGLTSLEPALVVT